MRRARRVTPQLHVLLCVAGYVGQQKTHGQYERICACTRSDQGVGCAKLDMSSRLQEHSES